MKRAENNTNEMSGASVAGPPRHFGSNGMASGPSVPWKLSYAQSPY